LKELREMISRARFTDKARRVLTLLRLDAKHALFAAPLDDRKVLLSLLRESNLAVSILTDGGMDVTQFARELGAGSESKLLSEQELVERANDQARRGGDRYVGTEHILLALANLPSGAVATRLAAHGLEPKRLQALLNEKKHPSVAPRSSIARRAGTLFRFVLRRLTK
jgi:ATP-dependent Clp protease ATP-binding subunit ClpA